MVICLFYYLTLSCLALNCVVYHFNLSSTAFANLVLPYPIAYLPTVYRDPF